MKVVLVPNQIDRRTLEGRQLVEELEQFGEEVAPPPPIGPPMSAALRQAIGCNTCL
jgi:hypothetical protein